MSSDCSISLAGPAVEAAGRDLPPAPQARAVRKIVSRCQWRDWSNRFRCQLRPAQRRAFYPARSSQRVSPGGPRKNERPRRKVVRAGASLPEITLGGSNRAAMIILTA